MIDDWKVTCICRGEQQQQRPQQASTFALGEWQVHVLSNLPFFALLLPLFLDLEVSRLAAGSRPDSQELLKVLCPLAAPFPSFDLSIWRMTCS